MVPPVSFSSLSSAILVAWDLRGGALAFFIVPVCCGPWVFCLRFLWLIKILDEEQFQRYTKLIHIPFSHGIILQVPLEQLGILCKDVVARDSPYRVGDVGRCVIRKPTILGEEDFASISKQNS